MSGVVSFYEGYFDVLVGGRGENGEVAQYMVHIFTTTLTKETCMLCVNFVK